jgi:hypothetical protein
VDALAHRCGLYAEHLSDFSRAERFQVAQHESTAIEVRQSIEGSRRLLREEAPIEQFVRPRGELQLRWRVAMRARRVEFGQKRFQRFDRPACASPAVHLQGDIVGVYNDAAGAHGFVLRR